MPTGVVIPDARGHLFAAAERVLQRDGPTGLTSRAVTAEAGVAKGVLHRHFADFDEFLAEFARTRIARIEARTNALLDTVGNGSVSGNLAAALADVFDPATLGVLALVMTRDELRARLRDDATPGLPIATNAVAMVATYLGAERDVGRLTPDADPQALALSVVGTGHLLFAGELGAYPDADAVTEVVQSILVAVERQPPPGDRPRERSTPVVGQWGGRGRTPGA
ncbi:MAG: TetR/AcrR family transcriptional regulator [Micromonosporaceae bacterium]|nr:TetR/AcrR family transcriptional regulator [Micromonosporaceae bacterium]